MSLEWAERALTDLAVLDKATARRIRVAIEHLDETGLGNVKRLAISTHPNIAFVLGIFVFGSSKLARTF